MSIESTLGQYRDWTIRLTVHPLANGWSAIIEVWTPKEGGPKGWATTVPFAPILETRSTAAEMAMATARHYIRRVTGET